MICLKCGNGITLNVSNIKEEINGVESQIRVKRGFCFNCGTLYRNNIKNFTLTVHKRNSTQLDSFSLLESGDTFSEVWVLVETYREIFRTDSKDNRYLLRISTLKEEYKDENDKPRGKYIPIYEEVIQDEQVEVTNLQEELN